MSVPLLPFNPSPTSRRPRRRSAAGRVLLAALALGLGALPAAAVGAVQLTAAIDQTAASLGGQPVQYGVPPRLVNGRAMLPLRETAALLGQRLSDTGGQMQVGRLTVDSARGTATLGGAPQPEGSVATVDSVLYVSVRLLADALGANLSVESGGRTVTLTALREGGDPLAPQARFSTDRVVYAPGERVVFTDYPFDPDGADIVSRKWTGRQDAYFQPGTYTVTLQVTNSRGLVSAPYSRTIQVQGAPVATPLSYALRYAEPGDRFADPLVSGYPTLTAVPTPGPSYPLLFSDSPEAPTQSGVLYQDSVSGRARLLAYHLNALGRPARLYILARNLEATPLEVRTERLGETAPTRIEGLLGQVTLLDYFASTGSGRLTLAPGQSAPLYASPTLNPGSGANVMQDLTASGRVEITFVMLEESLPATAQVVQQIPYLQPDGKHQRGTFEGAVRSLRVNLTSLPARLVIGDGRVDPALNGVDRLTGRPQRLMGNYGVLYDLEVFGAGGTAVAFSPRGGVYRGAMNIVDGPLSQTIKLPRSGAALTPDQPVLLWRPQSDRLDIDFVPASGSNLPISLIFYPGRPQGGVGGLLKNYQP